MKKCVSKLGVLALWLSLLVSSNLFAADQYALDKDHSDIGFKVKHLGISNVKGKFGRFSGKLTVDGKTVTGLTISIETDSVNTDNKKRDDHLRKPDFFDTKAHKAMSFVSTSVKQAGSDLLVVGRLTIKGITKEVKLKGEFGGIVLVKKWGVYKAGLELRTKINRQEFGLKFNDMLGSGDLMVADDVKIILEIEANRKAKK